MPGQGNIPFVDISIDPKNFDVSVLDLLTVVRPTWGKEQLQSKTYSEGYINNMKRFHLRSDNDLQDAIVVRVYGSTLDTFVNREKEVLAMQVAHAAGCFQPLVAIFKNGVAYKYAHGRTLTTSDLNDPKIIRLATKKLAQFVTTDPDKVDLIDCNGGKGVFDKSDRSDHMLKMMIGGLKEQMDCPRRDKIYQEHRLPTAMLIEELMKMKGITQTCGWKPELSHGDWHLKNIIFDEKKGTVVFCDYELTEFRNSPGMHDIQYMFSTRPILEKLGMIGSSEPQITDESRKLWIRSFTESKQECLGRDPDLAPEALFELAEIDVAIMSIASALGMMAFTGSMAEKGVLPFEIIDFLPFQRKTWDERKDDLPDLVARRVELQKLCQDYLYSV